ncbi:glycine dehydrogenase, putative [Bodo saltans]|uniref:Glycine cleavage system P protein n=1 Tax=Bodo saltans TaxID=75058 RepID=A0A0S4IQD3_BODSA|nr:glycine dehydrogenase, putative [Bodo saltans]|eukprot:CUE86272.1 glycine dehydrogenase, putative [Bodo saltans]
MMRRFALRPLQMFAGARFAHDDYINRHIGPNEAETAEMLKTLGATTLDEFIAKAIPANIVRPPMKEFKALSEKDALSHLRHLMSKNKLHKSLIGQGYYDAILPPVIQRNVLENPNWYTPYTPYQAEISQGRLESLLNYQTMITDITKMPIANASLLDQATAASEAMYAAFQAHKGKRAKFFVSSTCFQSTIEMLRTRAAPLGIEVVVGDVASVDLADPSLSGILVQTPDATGAVHDFTDLFAKAKQKGVFNCCGGDLLAMCVTKPPGEMGADIVLGSAQRFGIPLGYGGPHAAFFAVRDDLKRSLPGRLIGVSKDANGEIAIRMALQTREQHIKRDRATSNICTAQALLANMSAFYGIYHGQDGLVEIANSVHLKAKTLAIGMESAGHEVVSKSFFDTVTVKLNSVAPSEFVARCAERGVVVAADLAGGSVTIALDEATMESHVTSLLEAAGLQQPVYKNLEALARQRAGFATEVARKSPFLQQRVFKSYQNEHELMRYIQRLSRKDYGLTHGAIPLGSCTMKLNAAATMIPMSWPEVNGLHPLVPDDHSRGYSAMCLDLEQKLKEVTGFAAVSLQPNSGAQGEYAGLRVIRAYHASKGEGHRDVCLIPQSAHGTNPASAVLAGMKIVVVKCLPDGRIDVKDLEENCKKHAKQLACVMITYPSTYGVFDSDIVTCTTMVHEHGGQVYIDGANLNAMVGVTGPGFFGGDVCHINMHKTFSIPHGGGGPGMGPIAVREHLAPFLPNSALGPKVGGSQSFGQVSQAPYGSASILSISYMLMTMLGSSGLRRCTEYAILNANYLRKRLEQHYPILFVGDTGCVAHEFIIDVRGFKKSANVEAEDVAKRLMDYGLHAPTLSFPVAGTLMIEPTESESKYELDRIADALISIREEIAQIERGEQPTENNVLKNAPHTARVVTAADWTRPYTRQLAAYPSSHTVLEKYWPTVSRIDGAYGDRNLICSCVGIESYKD